MAGGAKVESIEALEQFRLVLMKFAEKAGNAIGEADSDIARTLTWLETEQSSYWSTQVRRSKEALARAQEALRMKRLFKDASGNFAPASEEQKAVSLAQRRCEEAEARMAAVKRWIPRLRRELELYRGNVSRFSTCVSALIPEALARLEQHARQLWAYAQLAPDDAEVNAPTADDGETAPEQPPAPEQTHGNA